MADFLVDTQAAPNTPAAGQSILFPHVSSKRWATKDDAGRVLTIDGIQNESIADQVANAADTYLVGSALAVPSHGLQARARFRWRAWMSKTAAGVATPTWTVRIGTLGTVADAARLVFVGPAQTAVIDAGFVEIECLLRNVGAAAVLTGVLYMSHNLQITGLALVPTPTVLVTSAAFDSTVANLIAGVSINPGAAGVWTHTGIVSELVGV